MHFAASERSTLGIEWELATIDPTTRELVPAAPDVIAAAVDDRIKGEFFTNTIELVTGVHRTTSSAVAEMRELRDAAVAAASATGVRLIGAGTHPFSRWRDQQLTDSPRYHRVIEKSGTWAERLIILGVHNHVGVESRDKAMPIMRAVLDALPLVSAIAASSPFWQGEDTGFSSQRAMLFQQLPTGGLPPVMADWREFERVGDDMLRIGVVDAISELRWDVRPSLDLGTVEARIADGAPSLADVAAITALTHCLVEEASRRIDDGTMPEHLPSWFVRENKWRTARSGLDADVVVDAAGTCVPARQAVADAVERLAGIAADLGASSGMRRVGDILANGSSAERQRAAYASGGLHGVVDALADELEA